MLLNDLHDKLICYFLDPSCDRNTSEKGGNPPVLGHPPSFPQPRWNICSVIFQGGKFRGDKSKNILAGSGAYAPVPGIGCPGTGNRVAPPLGVRVPYHDVMFVVRGEIEGYHHRLHILFLRER